MPDPKDGLPTLDELLDDPEILEHNPPKSYVDSFLLLSEIHKKKAKKATDPVVREWHADVAAMARQLHERLSAPPK